MRRLAVGLAGVALLIALLPTQVSAGVSPVGPEISVVHGLGTTPGANPVDVYIREAGGGDFALVIAGEESNFGFGAMQDVGSLPPGDYDVLVCSAAAAPLETIADCEDNSQSSANGNSGNPVTLPDTQQVVLFAGWSAVGRPEVIPFTIDMSCIADAASGRATAANGAYANPLTITVGGAVILQGVARGTTASIDAPAGSYDVNISNDQIVDIDTTIVVGAQQNTVTYLTGNPVTSKVSYELLTQTFPLETCPPPSSETTSTTAATQAATQPRFTG